MLTTDNSMTQRNLVTVRKVSALRPIQGADRIEAAQIDGWQVVVKKGEFQVGDTCVYFEIDSFLPEQDERFSFLHKNGLRTMGESRGSVLRTIKLRQTLSQGLALPLAEFRPELLRAVDTGQSLDALLGIQKYESPVPASLGGEVAGAIPSVIRKTDQERVQNLTLEVLTDLLKEKVLIGEVKLDGTSMTVYCLDEETAHVCGHNWEFKNSTSNSLTREASRLGLLESLPHLCKEWHKRYALQGELIGAGVNGNNERLQGRQEWVVFDVFDVDSQSYAGDEEKLAVVEALFGQQEPKQIGDVTQRHERLVPSRVLEIHSPTPELFIKEMLDAAEQGPSRNPARPREGLVVKSHDRKFSFKAISNAYLLKAESKQKPGQKAEPPAEESGLAP